MAMGKWTKESLEKVMGQTFHRWELEKNPNFPKMETAEKYAIISINPIKATFNSLEGLCQFLANPMNDDENLSSRIMYENGMATIFYDRDSELITFEGWKE